MRGVCCSKGNTTSGGGLHPKHGNASAICFSTQPIWWKGALKTSKDTVFPSLSKVSILNQYYHFKYDQSKKNLQKPFLLQEIDTHDRKKIINPSNLQHQARPQLTFSPAVLLLSSQICQQVTFTLRWAWQKKALLLSHEVSPSCPFWSIHLSTIDTKPLYCNPSEGEGTFSKGQQATQTAIIVFKNKEKDSDIHLLEKPTQETTWGRHPPHWPTYKLDLCVLPKQKHVVNPPPLQGRSWVRCLRCGAHSGQLWAPAAWDGLLQLSQLHSGTEFVQVKAEGQQGWRYFPWGSLWARENLVSTASQVLIEHAYLEVTRQFPLLWVQIKEITRNLPSASKAGLSLGTRS